MQVEIIDKVKMAERFYYLAVKFENKLPAGAVKMAKETCNKYIKIAKEMNLYLDKEELIDIILK